jgi:hypothetical protein
VSRRTYVFASAAEPEPIAAILSAIEQVMGRPFDREPGRDPALRAGPLAVYVGGHDFDDGDIDFPDGTPVPLRSGYPSLVDIRDTERDQGRQEAAAARIFTALTADGTRKAVVIDDMQHILASSE